MTNHTPHSGAASANLPGSSAPPSYEKYTTAWILLRAAAHVIGDEAAVNVLMNALGEACR